MCTTSYDGYPRTATLNTNTLNTKTYWYSYDVANRVVVANGQNSNGQVVLGSGAEAYEQRYDAAGNVIVKRYRDEDGVIQYDKAAYDAQGHLTTTQWYDSQQQTFGLREKRHYDAAGRLLEVREYDPAGATRQVKQLIPDPEGTYEDPTQPNLGKPQFTAVNSGGWVNKVTRYVYNADGQVLLVDVLGKRPLLETEVMNLTNTDSDTLLTREQQIRYASVTLDNPYTNALADINLGTDWYDAAGRLTNYDYEQVSAYGSSTGAFTHRFTYQYRGAADYLESRISGVSVAGKYHGQQDNFKPASSTLAYDPFGRLLSVRDASNVQGAADRLKLFAYNGDGAITYRANATYSGTGTYQADANPTFYYHAAGQLLGEVDKEGHITFADRMTGYSAGSSQRVTVQAGDTLKSIAQRVYGNASYWYVIADANGLAVGDELPMGSTLTTPTIENHHNDAGTFKPYQPGELIGSTSPNLPYVVPPPSDHGCSKIVQIIMVVVMVVATVYTAGLASAAASTTLGSALAAGGATVGMNIATQAVNNMTGLQDGYDFGQALQAGVTAGLTTGISQAVNTAAGAKDASDGITALDAILQSGAGQAAASYLTNYAVGKAINPDQTHFSLRSLAVNTASGYLAEKLGLGKTPRPEYGLGGFDSTQFTWSAVAAESLKAITRRGLSYGLNKLAGVDDHWNGGFEFANALGEGLGSTLLSDMKWKRDTDEARRLFKDFLIREHDFSPQDAEAYANKHLDQLLGPHGRNWNMGGATGSWTADSDNPSYTPEDIARIRADLPDAQRAVFDKALAHDGITVDKAREAASMTTIKDFVDNITRRSQDATLDPNQLTQLAGAQQILSAALFSYDAYFDQSISELLPMGYQRVTGNSFAQYGLSAETLDHNSISGYFGALYSNGNANDPLYYANRGSENWRDYEQANIPQGFGHKTEQYRRAKDIALDLVTTVGLNRVIFTGHSLGGGLASAQTLVTGARSIVFNPANVHPNTYKAGYVKGSENNISRFTIQGEILDYTQENLLLPNPYPKLPGMLNPFIDPMPNAIGQQFELTPVSAPWQLDDGRWLPGVPVMPLTPLTPLAPVLQYEYHGMNHVLESLYYRFFFLPGN